MAKKRRPQMLAMVANGMTAPAPLSLRGIDGSATTLRQRLVAAGFRHGDYVRIVIAPLPRLRRG